MTTTTATNLRRLAVAAVITGAAALGMTALGDLATADAKPAKPVIVLTDGPANCHAMGGIWVWDGFETGHCERRSATTVLFR